MKTITLARKPFVGTVAKNVMEHGCGGLNIDASRIRFETDGKRKTTTRTPREENGVWTDSNSGMKKEKSLYADADPSGRFPANLILKEEVAEVLDEQSGESISSGGTNVRTVGRNGIYGAYASERGESAGGFGDSGGASRFFKRVKK